MLLYISLFVYVYITYMLIRYGMNGILHGSTIPLFSIHRITETPIGHICVCAPCNISVMIY